MARELDAEVLKSVMGWSWDESICEVCGWPLDADVPSACRINNCSVRPRPAVTAKEKSIAHYSTDIAAAMEVVGKMCERGWRVSLNTHAIEPSWSTEMFYWEGNNCRREHAESNSLPEAICRAALSAIQVSASASALSQQDTVESSSASFKNNL